MIVIGGVVSIWLSQSPAVRSRRWAPIIGLAAQPAWLYASIKAEQYGIATLSLVYAAGWIRGVRTLRGAAISIYPKPGEELNAFVARIDEQVRAICR